MKIEANEPQDAAVSVFASSRGNVKNLIVQVLGREWPLSPKVVWKHVDKDFGSPMTYQGVHKAMKQLQEQGIVLKTEGGYRLNMSWLLDMQSFSDMVRKKYITKVSEGASIDRMSFVFETIADADAFLIDAFLSLKPSNSVLYTVWNHFWVPLFLGRSTYDNMKTALTKFKVYDICSADTPLDRWCVEYWKKYGLNLRIGVDVGTKNSFIACGDYVVEVFYPPALLKEMDAIFSRSKNLHDLDLHALVKNIFEKKSKIPVIVAKDAALAEHYKTLVMGAFERPKEGNRK